MGEVERKKADQTLEKALATRGARDPREFYRDLLRQLKGDSPSDYQRAVEYYDQVLVPEVVSGETDPLTAWLGYGRTLAELMAPGVTVDIDQTGKRHAHDPAGPADVMVLHIPDARNRRAIVVGLPAELSTAQRATFEFLVRGKQKLA